MQSEFLTIESVVEVFPNRRGRAYAWILCCDQGSSGAGFAAWLAI